jgi:hypothetical protein
MDGTLNFVHAKDAVMGQAELRVVVEGAILQQQPSLLQFPEYDQETPVREAGLKSDDLLMREFIAEYVMEKGVLPRNRPSIGIATAKTHGFPESTRRIIQLIFRWRRVCIVANRHGRIRRRVGKDPKLQRSVFYRLRWAVRR